MNLLLNFLGYIFDKLYSLLIRYKTIQVNQLLGGGNRYVSYPNIICGISNIISEEPVSIGPNSTIYTTGAKLIIKKHFISGPNLTIITGDHHSIVGKFIDEVKEEDKIPENDKDVIIEEDVWCGANVTILKGVTIGRGTIIAAGSVVTKSCPPYSIIGGVPAKIIKQRFSKSQIVEHEKSLYNLCH